MLWDSFLKLYQDNAVTPSGLTVPIVASVGNHEAGGFDQPLSRLRFYTRYFVQESLEGRQPQELPTHHVQYISNQVMIALDSQVVETAASQVGWLSTTLSSAAPGSFKTALYRAPEYPSVRPFNDAESTAVHKIFVPVFDQHNLAVSFENHDHAYKRTNRMRGGNTDPTGTLYWVMERWEFLLPENFLSPLPSPSDKPYLVQRQARSFFLHVKVNPGNYTVDAIDSSSMIFDSVCNTYP
jgi:hypothetical protein